MLDYSTCVIADKFGSISVIRLPEGTNEDTQVIKNDICLYKKQKSNLIKKLYFLPFYAILN